MRGVLGRAFVVFVLALVLCGAGVWIPTQSRDEAATLSAVQRTWPQLWAMLDNVDLVHGLFYAAMKVWLSYVPTSTLTLRLPSVVGCALAAGLTVVLGTLLANRRVGVLAGLVLAVMPRITRIATEGRSAALFTAVAVLLVLLVVLATRRPSFWWWLPVGLVTAVLGGLHIYTLLLLPVLVGYLWLVPVAGDGPRLSAFVRGRLLWPALGVVLGAVPVGWLALRARTQQAQVDWIDVPSLQTLAGTAAETVSPRNSLWGVIAYMCAAAGMAWLSRHRGQHRGAAFLLVGWLVWPTLALITISAVWTPLYSHRYMAFCTPALAVLAAMGLATVKRKLLAFVLGLALPLATVVTYREQRQVDAWDSWGEIMAILAYRGQPGDAVIDYPLVSGMEVSYPAAFAPFRVVNGGADRITRSYLWDERLPLAQVEPRLRGVRRLWYLTPTSDPVLRTMEIARLHQLGFGGEMLQRGPSEQTWLFTRTLAETERGDRLLPPG